MTSVVFYACFYTFHLIVLQYAIVTCYLYEVLGESDYFWKTLEIIIKNCFTKFLGNFILIGDWSTEENIILSTIFYNGIPVNLASITSYNIFHHHKCPRGFFKINETVINTKCKLAEKVIIIVSSNLNLVNILTNLRMSVWWNNEAEFLIINTHINKGCQSAKRFLKIVWNFKILSALYFCKNDQNQMTIYNFNPFARIGTHFWRIVEDYKNENERWALLQFHGIDMTQCSNFHIDKTKNFQHYHMRIGSVQALTKRPKNPKPGFADYGERDLKVFDIMLQILNATATLKYYDSIGFITKNGTVGFLKDTELGAIDFVAMQMFMRSYWKHMTYPFDSNGVCIVARMYPVSFTQRFTSIFTAEVWFCLIATGFVSLITLMFIFNQSLISALVEFLRLFFGTSSLQTPSNSRCRFFFINILFLIFMINLYIQSRLSAVLADPGYAPTIDSPDDLIDSNVLIYGEMQHQEFIYQPKVRQRLSVIDDINICLKRLVNNEMLICLSYSDVLKAFGYLNDEIYKARQNLFDRPIAYTFVEDWPLAAKINSLLKDMNEVGIYQFCRDDWARNDEKTDEENIDLQQLNFFFTIFFWGCILSICLFLVEIVVAIFKLSV